MAAVVGDGERTLFIASVAVVSAGLISESDLGRLQLPHASAGPWASDSRAPFLTAATVFLCHLASGVVFLIVFKSVRQLRDCWGNRFHLALQLQVGMCCYGALMYLGKWLSLNLYITEVPGVGPYLFSRHVHWLVSSPVQWYLFGLTCTPHRDPHEVWKVCFSCFAMQIYGILFVSAQDMKLQIICFIASCGYFVRMFWLAFHLPLMANMAIVGHRVLCFKTGIWSLYPVVSALRWMGVISSWTEQVLILTVLDLVAKTITFSSILACRVILVLAHIPGSMQLVMASHDCIVPVNNKWELLGDEGHPLVMSMLISVSQSDSYEISNFLSLCTSDSDKTKLQDAAYIADAQLLNSPPPKVSITLHCNTQSQANTEPAGLAVECHISKLLHGRRVIGVHLNDNESRTVLAVHDSQSPLKDNCSTSEDPKDPSEHLSLVMTLGLHNCCETLKLTAAVHGMLTVLFQSSSLACAIFVWSEATSASIAPTLVVASRRLQSDWLPGHPMPQAFTKLLAEDGVTCIINALKASKSTLHQWTEVTTCGGVATTVAVVPLNRLSRDGATADVQLCLLTIGAGITDTIPTEPSYAQWQAVHGRLVLLGEATATAMKPPHMLAPLASACVF